MDSDCVGGRGVEPADAVRLGDEAQLVAGRELDVGIEDGADLADGLLTIALRRELPEILKPRTIPIGTAQAPAQIGKKEKAA